MNFVKFTRTSFSKEHLWWLLLIQVNLVAPATNAILEKHSSTLKRAKTLILSTMIGRLNYCILIFICKEELDEINIKLIKNEFIKVKESRISIFELYQF